ncbi:MobH family relaxase [Billgrantia montanilacus]|uniref:Relaxase n=1 Tax=Billgrantia montanilacus TaxID=2282305 RepID=A0A368TMS8_9GAMM|nr:MobH family relaxase [Halomonas montanilacus]RCV85975.1 relaxase [Halomonas montanilacus]
MLKRLLSMKKNADPIPIPQERGWWVPLKGAELLDTPYRQQVLKSLWDLTSLTQPVFDDYVRLPLKRYAELVQLLPASENHHHAYAGGMLDHALEVVSFALRLRRQHLLPPGATPEEQASVGELWTIAVVYAALLHDIAKILVDIDIILQDGRVWRLWQGTIPTPYRVQYRKGRDYQLHQVSNSLLCHQILGSRGMEWLISDPAVFGQFMYTITGYSHESGIIGEFVSQADRASVASSLGGDPSRALEAPVESLQRKLVDALRYLVKEQLPLNSPRAPAYLTEEGLWIVAPSVPNQLKAYLLQHGVGGVPSNTTRMYDEMQAHGLIEASGEGKAVWKGDVQIGEWQASLSFLKVTPSVIWGAGEERPPLLAGTLRVIGSESSVEKGGVVERAAHEAVPQVTSHSSVPTGNHAHEQEPEPQDMGREKLGAETANIELDVDDIVSLITGKDCSDYRTDNGEVDSHASPSAKLETVEREGRGGTQDLGQAFFHWLSSGLVSKKIIVNDAKAAVHVVEGTYFLVSPGIFRRFCNEQFGSDSQWEKVQRRFQKLGLHLRTATKTNIFKVSVQGPNRKGSVLKGYLLKSESSMKPLARDNVYLSLIKDEAEHDA